MTSYRFPIISTLSLIACFGLAQWISAQTWTDPSFAPPKSQIPNITTLAGDNLGNHQAQFNLNMNGWPIMGIGTKSGGTSPSLSAAATGAGLGLDIDSTQLGLYAESSTDVGSGRATVGAFNRGTGGTNGYGLVTNSTGAISAQLYDTLVLEGQGTQNPQLQLGQNALATQGNVLGTTAASQAATRSLYYGSSLLCDNTLPNCGFALTGSFVADNLGLIKPHTAGMNLNMNGNRIINVVASYSTSTPAATQTGQAPAVIVSNGGGSHIGTPVALYGEAKSANSLWSGIYGLHGGTGPGILAASANGTPVEIHGRFNSMKNQTATDQYINFGPIAGVGLRHNSLQSATTSAGMIPSADSLYWGDRLLCDKDKDNCGWQTQAGVPVVSQWLLNGQTVYYQASNVSDAARTNVGIGVTAPDYQLQVTGLTRATGGYLGTLLLSTATINNELQIGNDLRIGGNITLNSITGVQIDGEITVSATGITIGGTRLNSTDLQNIITACRNNGGGC